MRKEIVSQVQEVQRVPYRINPKRNTLRHILIKISKIKYKENILKETIEMQQIKCKVIPIMLTADLSAEHRNESPPPGSLHNPLNQTKPLGADTKNNRNDKHAACKKETPNTVS